jgi:ribosomal protein S18 acetylase RimI-like enzyme
VVQVSGAVVHDPQERPDRIAGQVLADALPDDTFAQVCGLGGLVVEVHTAHDAALWRGHPWGTGWTVGGSPTGIRALLDEHRPPEFSVPESRGIPPGHRRGWAWGWHATCSAPAFQSGEDRVDWLDEGDMELAGLVARAFPDAETPPGDPRVQRWFGGRQDGRLVACAAELRTGAEVALLSSLTVESSVRRSGWGAAVTTWFARERFRSGTRVVGLGTSIGNTRARALYRRVGFLDVPYLGAAREDVPVTKRAEQAG